MNSMQSYPVKGKVSAVHKLVEAEALQPSETTQADMIVEYLARIGVEVIFGVPGGAIEPFMNALARSARRGGPRLVVARHECGAAFMAEGYYRETGKIGVVCATTGPGTTNMITGVGSAVAEKVPMLIISAQTPLPKFGKNALQESSCTAIDTVGMFRYITKFNTLVSHHEQLEGKLVAAIMAAHRAPYGPAHISIPSDVLRAPAKLRPHIHADLLTQEYASLDSAAIEVLCTKLAKVDGIAVYIGDGVGKAQRQIMQFIEMTGAGFVASPSAKGWVNENHPQYHGVFGFAGHSTARELFKSDDVDLIIAIGAELEELGTSGWAADLLNTKLVHIDSVVEHFTRSPMANLHVFGDLQSIFSRLIKDVEQAKSWGRSWKALSAPNEANAVGGHFSLQDEEKCFDAATPIKPQRLMHTLSCNLPEETRVYVDAGNAWAWTTHYLTSSHCGGAFNIGMGFGSMAWSVGAAIGAAVGNPRQPTLCIVGDGSYLMSAQEITVAQQHRLPVVFLILNDSALGMVRHGQELGQQESIGWELTTIDFAAMTRAMGIASEVVETPKQLSQIDFRRLFARSGPTLLDVRIDADEIPPMGDRIKGLAQNASATPGG